MALLYSIQVVIISEKKTAIRLAFVKASNAIKHAASKFDLLKRCRSGKTSEWYGMQKGHSGVSYLIAMVAVLYSQHL